MLSLHLHHEVIAALQFAHGHPCATLLYFRFLTYPALWTDGCCEVQFPSELALLKTLQPGLAWHRIQPLLRHCIDDFKLTQNQHHEVVAQHALARSWPQIVRRTRQQLQAHPQYKYFNCAQETAWNHLFSGNSLQWKVRPALDPVVTQLPWLSFGRKGLQLAKWIRQLQEWEVVETELSWLQDVGLLQSQYSASGLHFTLTPLIPPPNASRQAAAEIVKEESETTDG